MAAVVLPALAALIISTATPIKAAATGGYPYSHDPCTSCPDPWRFIKRQCTSFVAWKLNTANQFRFMNDFDGNGTLDFGNASNWKSAAIRFGYRVDNTPATGAVAWERGGNHVAWVESVNGSSVTIQEYNHSSKPLSYNRRTADARAFEFIHFKDLNAGHTFTPGVYNKSGDNYQFHLSNLNQSNPANHIFKYGNHNGHHAVVAGDWDGNGTTTVGVVGRDGNNLRWFLRNSNSNGGANIVFNYGRVGDTPIVGDWDGNGTVTVGVVRQNGSSWQWLLRNSNSGGHANISFNYGPTASTPISGDWDGNGTWTPGVVIKASDGRLRWQLRNSNSQGAYHSELSYGRHAMIPIAGDWDGDGKFTPGAVERTSTNLRWHLRNSNTSGPADRAFIYGSRTHTPIVGNWDGKS